MLEPCSPAAALAGVRAWEDVMDDAGEDWSSLVELAALSVGIGMLVLSITSHTITTLFGILCLIAFLGC